MSFLSRRNSRPDKRGGRADAGRRAETDYDDYGYDYAPDNYQDDENWSPDQYFSPEGIKGRWAAGARPGDRPGGRGRHADGRGYAEPDAGDDEYGSQPTWDPAGEYGRDSHYRDAYGQDDGNGDDAYDTGGFDAYDTGGFDVPGGAEGDQSERSGGRRRRDRGERRRRRGRRDKGDDIWPDDGVSDEDYWASVTAERPLASASGAPDADSPQAADNRPLARPAAPAGPASTAGQVSAAGPVRAARPASESRPAAEPRPGSGRLGPPPGMNGYPSRSNSGPMPRPVTGPIAARPAAGLAQPPFHQPAPIQPGASPAGPPQPSFQPTGSRVGGRQPERPDRPDWTEQTERMDRVSSTGYPEPRTSGRRQPASPAPPPPAPPAPARGRGDSADRRLPDRRDLGREPGRTTGGWLSADDDPLTSTAYSRSALVDTDGRSYRAAHRSQVPADRRAAALTEQTQTFGMNGQFQADPQAPTASYPGYNGQQPGQQPSQPGQRQPGRHSGQPPVQQPRQPVQSHPYDQGATSSYPYPSQPYPSRPVLDADEEQRYGRPPRAGGGNGHGGYPSGNGTRADYGRGYGDNRGGRY